MMPRSRLRLALVKLYVDYWNGRCPHVWREDQPELPLSEGWTYLVDFIAALIEASTRLSDEQQDIIRIMGVSGIDLPSIRKELNLPPLPTEGQNEAPPQP